MRDITPTEPCGTVYTSFFSQLVLTWGQDAHPLFLQTWLDYDEDEPFCRNDL